MPTTYLFENHTNSDFLLPKRTPHGVSHVPSKNTFQGDDYYVQFVPQFLRILRVLESHNNPTQDRLILEQPPTVTQDGVVEYVVQNSQLSLNEKAGDGNHDSVVLLNENPLSGVEIL